MGPGKNGITTSNCDQSSGLYVMVVSYSGSSAAASWRLWYSLKLAHASQMASLRVIAFTAQF